jgi:hypothetical protein
MANIQIQVEAGHVEMTGTAFMVYANRYHDAAIKCLSVKRDVPGFDPVPYYLLCQSLELYLKSYIWLVDRIGAKTIKHRYGHRLEALWADAKALGIGRYARATSQRDRVIRLIGPFYSGRQLSYLDLEMLFRGYPALAAEPAVIPVLKRLTAQLGRALHGRILGAR